MDLKSLEGFVRETYKKGYINYPQDRLDRQIQLLTLFKFEGYQWGYDGVDYYFWSKRGSQWRLADCPFKTLEERDEFEKKNGSIWDEK